MSQRTIDTRLSRDHRDNAMSGAVLRRGVQLCAVLCVCGWLAACDNHEGPMERAGEKIDKAATDVGNAIEDKCEETKEAAGAEDTRC